MSPSNSSKKTSTLSKIQTKLHLEKVDRLESNNNCRELSTCLERWTKECYRNLMELNIKLLLNAICKKVASILSCAIVGSVRIISL